MIAHIVSSSSSNINTKKTQIYMKNIWKLNTGQEKLKNHERSVCNGMMID